MAEQPAPNKKAVQSKTLWINAVALVLIFAVTGIQAPEVKEWVSANYPWIISSLPVINIILRFLTTQPIGPSED